jgi:siroheme synthase
MLKPGVCMAVYMGVAQAWKIQSTLQATGLPGCILGDWVENAGKPNMRRISTRLDRLSNDAKQNDVKNPAILFLRYPVSLYEELELQRTRDIATQQ